MHENAITTPVAVAGLAVGAIVSAVFAATVLPAVAVQVAGVVPFEAEVVQLKTAEFVDQPVPLPVVSEYKSQVTVAADHE